MILDIKKETVKPEPKAINEYSFLSLFKELKKEPDKKAVKKINVIPNDVNICKIYSDGQAVYANTTFFKNDIIEICPTRSIMKSALYDHDIRQIVFEVVRGEEFVIPFGYCQYYNISNKSAGIMPNCTYLWDPNTKVIVIKALCRIEKTDKLILDLGN